MTYTFKFSNRAGEGEVSTKLIERNIMLQLKLFDVEYTCVHSYTLGEDKYRKFLVRDWLYDNWVNFQWLDTDGKKHSFPNPIELFSSRRFVFREGAHEVIYISGDVEFNLWYKYGPTSYLMSINQVNDMTTPKEAFFQLGYSWKTIYKMKCNIYVEQKPKFPFSRAYKRKFSGPDDEYLYNFQIDDIYAEVFYKSDSGRYIILSKEEYADFGFLNEEKFKHIRNRETMKKDIEEFLKNPQLESEPEEKVTVEYIKEPDFDYTP